MNMTPTVAHCKRLLGPRGGRFLSLGRPGDMKHIPRKRFGQHFLSDQGIIEGIVQEIAPQPGDPMVEIGPGLAALTQPLVERLGRLTVIELDRDLAAAPAPAWSSST